MENVHLLDQEKNMRTKTFLLIILLFSTINLTYAEVRSTIFSYGNLPDIEVFYTIPAEINDQTKILFIMHGASRNADQYLAAWQPHVADRNVVAIAPRFTKELFPHYVKIGRAHV